MPPNSPASIDGCCSQYGWFTVRWVKREEALFVRTFTNMSFVTLKKYRFLYVLTVFGNMWDILNKKSNIGLDIFIHFIMGKKSYKSSHTDMLTANVSSICCFTFKISGNSTTYTRFTANQQEVIQSLNLSLHSYYVSVSSMCLFQGS